MYHPEQATSTSFAAANATFWDRAKAFGLDYLVIAAYLIALTVVISALRFTPVNMMFSILYRNPYSAQLSDSLMFDIPVILYFALFEASPRQATPGKRRLGLRVVTETGARLSVPRAVVRTVLKFLPWEIAHTSIWHTPGWPLHAQPTTLNYIGYLSTYALLGVYLLSLLFSRSRQTLYDQITHARVIVAPTSQTHER